MPRPTPPTSDLPFIEELLAVGEGAPTLEQKIELAKSIRATRPDLARQLDGVLFDNLVRLRSGLETAQGVQQELRGLLERLASPPWHPAVFLRAIETDLGPRAMVLYGGSRRVVALANGIDLDSLGVGEEVFLGAEGNVVTGRSPYGAPQYGETAFFERVMPDGRFVLRWRDEEVVVDVADALRLGELDVGDQVRWDRSAWMAFEKVAGARARRFLLDEVPNLSRAQVGGQDANLDLILSALTATLVSPALAALYDLGGRQAILMEGPPGCGKTIMARVAAAEVSRLSGKRCRFAVVKPGEWESPWVGETQMNIANTFRALRNVTDGFAVLFLDEIDSIGRIRGGAGNPHGDKSLTALLAELDGFADRSNIAIIAATNRKDLVDPALLERLSDVEITVQRPDMRGARAIFDIHVSDTVPVIGARGAIVETAVSRLYGPNAGNELCTLHFRDGKTRTVAARDLASGRTFAQICRGARLAAFLREVRGGERGMRVADMERAVGEAMQRLATTLTPRNVHAYLTDLPQDVDVVRVEPIVRKPKHPHRYRHAA
jgi:proteasome-associated ATPase